MAKLAEEEKASRAAARAEAGVMQAALDAEDRHRRSTETRERWDREHMYLTREQALAGEPCRSCGLPVIDGTGYAFKPLMKMTAEEREQRDADDAAFHERHRDCRGARWSMSGSRTQHCTECCPPLPLSQGQILELSRIFSTVRTSDADLVTWSHTLTCGHEVLGKLNRDNPHYRASGVRDCPECAAKKGVVSVERVEAVAVQPSQDSPPLTAQAQEMEDARREVADLRAALKSAEARLKKLAR